MDKGIESSIRCLVVDDEPLAVRLLEKHIGQFPQLELVAGCWNAIEAFEVLKREPVDLIFLDIQMPGLTGIDFVKSLQNPPAVIFTTAYREYAVESYELDVIDYLLKPITMDRFFRAINKYMDRQTSGPATPSSPHSTDSKEEPHIFVNTNRRYVKVLYEEVEYVESLKDYIRIHTSEKTITTKDKISDFEKKLPDYFMRVHRSFIVNTHKITAYTAQDIEVGQKEIPIGISYKQVVMKYLQGR